MADTRVTVGTTSTPIYPAGIQNDLMVRNMGSETVYLSDKSGQQIGIGYPLTPASTTVWKNNTPLHAICAKSCEIVVTENVTFVSDPFSVAQQIQKFKTGGTVVFSSVTDTSYVNALGQTQNNIGTFTKTFATDEATLFCFELIVGNYLDRPPQYLTNTLMMVEVQDILSAESGIIIKTKRQLYHGNTYNKFFFKCVGKQMRVRIYNSGTNVNGGPNPTLSNGSLTITGLYTDAPETDYPSQSAMRGGYGVVPQVSVSDIDLRGSDYQTQLALLWDDIYVDVKSPTENVYVIPLPRFAINRVGSTIDISTQGMTGTDKTYLFTRDYFCNGSSPYWWSAGEEQGSVLQTNLQISKQNYGNTPTLLYIYANRSIQYNINVKIRLRYTGG